MSDKQHKGQLQTVEGSAVGEFHVVPKFDYNCYQLLEYLGEAKIGIPDGVNSHYIQKFVYDSTLNLRRILIATNRATAGCTDVTVEAIGSKGKALVRANNGDFKEAETPIKGGGGMKKENELTTLTLDTGTQTIVGRIIEISEDGSEVKVNLNDQEQVVVGEANVAIDENDLTLLFNSDNKPYEKRRWTNRKRYFYETTKTS